MGMIGFFLRVPPSELRTYIRNSTLLVERIDAWYPGDPAFIDVDKAWEGLMYILTGSGSADESTHPLSKIFVSQNVIDEEQDLGYGPGTYVTAEEVTELNRMLAAISRDDLADRYDPDAMNDAAIYPEGWDDGPMLEYLLEHFDTLQAFYAVAAAHEEAVIAYVS